MARKLNKNLIALGSAAIVGVYAVGYAHTHPVSQGAAVYSAPVAAALATVTPRATATQTPAPAAPSVATAIARAIATASATAASAPTTAARAQTGTAAAGATPYRDGTYSGYGTSRRGDIEAAVTIQGGKITSVQITRATTYYPVSRIARLSGEVVDRQSAQVDFVSGATLSSSAFKSAVTQALSQAGA